MSFAEVRLPTGVGLGFTGGPEYSTDVVVLFSGQETRNQNRQDGKGAWQASYLGKTGTVTHELVAFFRARRGKFQGFRFKDHVDYTTALTEGVFVAGTVAGEYTMWKRYTSGGTNHDRRIRKPINDGAIIVKSGATVLVENTHYSVNYSTGTVTLLGSPLGNAPTSWSSNFDVPVRFDTDKLDITAREPDVYDWGGVGLVELINE